MVRKILLDPFDIVRYDSTIKPNSRTLHTTLMEKLKDTFQVISGRTNFVSMHTTLMEKLKKLKDTLKGVFQVISGRTNVVSITKSQQNEQSPKPPSSLDTRPGLFDYLTLGIFRGTHAAYSLLDELYSLEIQEASRTKKAAIYAGRILLAPLFVALLILDGLIRYAVSAALTVVFSPLVALVQPISLLIKYIKTKQFIETAYVFSPHAGTTVTLQKALGGLSANDVSVSVNPEKKSDASQEITFTNKIGQNILATTSKFTHQQKENLMEINKSAYDALEKSMMDHSAA
jgi:hypothetical protein